MKPLFYTPVGALGPVPGSEFHNNRGDHMHGGIDLNGRMNTIVYAPRAGLITVAGLSAGLGGNKVEIDHGQLSDGRHHYTKHYHFGPKHSHWEDVIFVRPGQKVKAGEPLGLCGMSGNATAPHDHYEHLVDGRQVDPLHYLRDYIVARRILQGLRLAKFYPASEGVDVLEAQQRLIAHGFQVRTDGVYGPLSQAQMLNFQRLHGLNADAIVGKQTWARLLERPSL